MLVSIERLPATTEGAVEGDEALRDRPLCYGQLVLPRGEFGLGDADARTLLDGLAFLSGR